MSAPHRASTADGPPAAAGHASPTFRMFSGSSGGFVYLESNGTTIGDVNSITSNGVLAGWWKLNNVGGLVPDVSGLKNIAAFQGFGPPISGSIADSGTQVGDIVLYYT